MTGAVLSHVQPYRLRLAGAVTAIVLSTPLQLSSPYILKVIIDDHLAHGDGDIGLLLLAAALAMSTAIVFEWYVARTTAEVASRASLSLQVETFKVALSLPMAFFDHTAREDVRRRLGTDIETIRNVIATLASSVIADITVIVTSALLLVWLDPRLLVIITAVVGGLYPLMRTFRTRARARQRAGDQTSAEADGWIHECFDNHLSLTLSRAVPYALSRFRVTEACRRAAASDTSRLYAGIYPAVDLVWSAAACAIIAGGAIGIERGVFTLGSMVAALQYTYSLLQPMAVIVQKLQSLQAGLAATERISEFLNLRAATAATGDAPDELPATLSGIEFEDVWFRYGGDDQPGPWVIEGLSFKVTAGETVGLTGESGAGKTTIISLILGLYRPVKGRILINSLDYRCFSPQALSRLFTAVLQGESAESGRTIRENIAEGGSTSSDLVLWQTFERICGPEMRSRLSKRLDTIVGGDEFLTPGESQLLCLARALASDRPGVILDEPSSWLDPHAERRFIHAFQHRSRQITFVVSHRVSTLDSMERIIVIKGGRLCQDGAPTALRRQPGIYSVLSQLQALIQSRALRRASVSDPRVPDGP